MNAKEKEQESGAKQAEKAAEQLPKELEYTFSIHKNAPKIWICALIGIICGMLSILSQSGTASADQSTVFVFFITIVIIVITVYFYGAYGLISSLLSSLLFAAAMKVGIGELFYNIGANLLQSGLALIAFKFLKADVKEKNSENAAEQLMDGFRTVLMLCGLAYFIASFIMADNVELLLIVGAAAVSVVYVVFAFVEKDFGKLKFLLLSALTPALVAGTVNSFYSGGQFFGAGWFRDAYIWVLSNYILVGTFGYFMLSVLKKKIDAGKKKKADKIDRKEKSSRRKYKLTVAVYYIADFIWNSAFYLMYMFDWLNTNTLVFVLPWAVGNLFFLANMVFSFADESTGTGSKPKDRKEAFDWFEKRAVVAEKNTQMLISIITFLLPISATFLNAFDAKTGIIFFINITFAVLTVGLIWVPSAKTEFMAFLKTLKTVSHLYTVSLLLLNAIMVINLAIAST